MEEFDFQIIANLLAGDGETEEKLLKLKGFLSSRNQTYRVYVVDKPTQISKIPAGGEIKIKKAVVCLGGDGTISETVGYVLNHEIDSPIAVIPTGTANIVANTLGIENEKNFAFLLNKKEITVDIGVAEYAQEKTFFILGLGLGFEENFLKLSKEKFKAAIGIFSYIFAALSELFSLKKIPIEIICDQKNIKTNVCLLTALNLKPRILTVFPLFKDDSIKGHDQLINIFYVEYRNFFQAFFDTLFFHILGSNFSFVKKLTGNEFLFKSPIAVGTQVDGELRSSLPVKISFHYQKARFFTS